MAIFDESAIRISVGKDLSGPDRFNVSFCASTADDPERTRRRKPMRIPARSRGRSGWSAFVDCHLRSPREISARFQPARLRSRGTGESANVPGDRRLAIPPRPSLYGSPTRSRNIPGPYWYLRNNVPVRRSGQDCPERAGVRAMRLHQGMGRPPFSVTIAHPQFASASWKLPTSGSSTITAASVPGTRSITYQRPHWLQMPIIRAGEPASGWERSR